jgi:hypothetical protein
MNAPDRAHSLTAPGTGTGIVAAIGSLPPISR